MTDVLEATWKLPQGAPALEDSLRGFFRQLNDERSDAAAPLGLMGTGEVTGQRLLLTSEDDLEPGRSDSLLLESVQPLRHQTEILPLKLTPGAWVDEFRLLREIGRGGMGAVFEVEDAAGRHLALKVAIGNDNPRRLLRLQREGQITAALNHPGIVRIHAGGTAPNGFPYLVYELVPGCRTLDQAWPDLTLVEKVETLRDAARALGHAHQAGVIHRDIKPENLLLDDTGRVRVADFGLAGGAGLGMDRVTREGTFLGTPPYAAPEQLMGCTGEVGPHSDVWSLGVVLYEALTGELPFLGETLRDQIRLVCHTTPARPREREASIPADLESVILCALSPDQRDRYPDAEAFADELDRFLAGREVEARTQFNPTQTLAFRLTLSACAGLLAMIFLGLALFSDPTPALISSAPRGWTAAPVVSGSVSGQVQDGLQLSVAGQPVKLDATGAFHVGLELEDGRHQVEVTLTRDGDLVSSERRTIQVDTQAPSLRWIGPALDEVSAREVVRVAGVVEDSSSPWIEVAVQGQSVGRFAAGETFQRHLKLQPGENRVVVELRDAAGNTSSSSRSVWLPPAWYTERSPKTRAPLPLPAGVVFGQLAGEYLLRRDGTTLVWIHPQRHKELAALAGVTGTFYLNGRHVTRISQGYFLSKYEVTWGQFEEFCRQESVALARPSFSVNENHAVHGVTWNDAVAYSEWAGGRLPTEAEWEYAAASSHNRAYPWGDKGDLAAANLRGVADGFERTAPVGSKRRDRARSGCFDMGGNVSEWTADVYGAIPTGQGTLVDPQGPATGPERVVKGGSYRSEGERGARNSRRLRAAPSASSSTIGFRILVPHSPAQVASR